MLRILPYINTTNLLLPFIRLRRVEMSEIDSNNVSNLHIHLYLLIM